MIQNIQKTAFPPPVVGDHTPSKEFFVDLIKTAQKVDHQVYSEQAITPVGFGVKAKTPSIRNLLHLPLQIKEKIATLLQNPAPATSKIFASSLIEVSAQCLNLCYSLLQPFIYLGMFTALIVKRLPLFITLQVVALTYALIEIGRNLWLLHKDHKFANICSLEPIRHYEAFDKATNKKEALLAMSHLITSLQSHATFLPSESYRQILQTLQSLKQKTELGETRFFDAQQTLLPLWNQIEKELVTAKIVAIKNKFLQFSSKEKEEQLQIATTFYDKLPYSEALHKSLDIIQHRFREKKT